MCKNIYKEEFLKLLKEMKINLTNRVAYTFIVFGILVLVAVGVYAFSSTRTGGDPAVMGHSANELNLTPLYFESTFRWVGVGATPTSGYTLDVVSPAALALRVSTSHTNSNVKLLGQGTGTGAGFQIDSQGGASYLAFLTQGAERMRITSAGNVGINTNSPVKRLDVNGDARVSGDFVVEGVIKSESGDVIIQLG